ncbi:hypothetical protein [Bdellovibrio svalbardensis]|uniref:ABM domain-containing protein n=1 Tax=Bdellovibrio svalbardensis TaxID=2972972 RepID=A0ABT6DHG6_9BACT|nr:hypothetical protein [Bdellovibrio svalbardensis]MDG0816246.1 hypothetical protein [Bdellovibrio svalbardensis]
MYAAIRRYKFDKKNAQELDKKIHDIFVPLIEKAPGFISYYWLDTGHGEGASVSVFVDKAGADESTRIAADFVKNNLGSLKLSTPEITEGKIEAHSESAPAMLKGKDKAASTRPSAH